MDLMQRYLTPVEAFGDMTFDQPLEWLRTADQESVLREIAYWLGHFDEVELSVWKQMERDWVAETIGEPHRSRLLSALRGAWTLVSPQSLLIAAKRAIATGKPSDVTDMRPLFMAAVAIQGGLGAYRQPDDDTATRHLALLTEVIRNQEFHRRPDRALRIAQSQLRWRDIPGRGGADLRAAVSDAFEQVTGVSLLDFEAAGFWLYAQAISHQGGVPTVASMAGAIHWKRERLDSVLALVSTTIEGAAEAIRREEAAFGEAWTFDTLRRWPVLRLEGDRILILSPHLMLERTFGWLPFYDMTMPDDPTDEIAATARRAKAPFEAICEREVIETLAVNVAAGRKRGRLFDGRTLRATYPGGQIADAAIAYGDEWLVIEVSSGQLKRETVVGGMATTLDDDLARLIDAKVDQIEATINRVRADPSPLLGGARRRRRFVPVLVIAEGVPVNPMTHVTINERLGAAGRLAAADIEPLHILDTEDLYVAETMAETDRLGLNEILEQHRHAGLMRRVDLRSWLLMDGRLRKVRPDRLQDTFDVAVGLINDTLGVDMEAVVATSAEKDTT